MKESIIIITTISDDMIVLRAVGTEALDLENEGITWIRGWYKRDSKEVAALLVARALGEAAQTPAPGSYIYVDGATGELICVSANGERTVLSSP